MSSLRAAIIETGTANLASVLAGLRRAGAAPFRARTTEDVERGEVVVLPGVGTFGAAMAAVQRQGIIEAIRRRVAADRPTLAICVGMQILCEASEESPGVEGLSVIPGRVERFEPRVRIPQLGWNAVEPEDGMTVAPGWAFFANSYRLAAAPRGWRTATARYAGPFIAALERGNILACQFHPELSARCGADLLRRWLYGKQKAESRKQKQEERQFFLLTTQQRSELSLAHRIIPCLDVRDGRVVKGIRFTQLRDAGSPVERAALYEAQGADEIVMLDISATDEGRRTAIETVRAIREVLSIPLTIGGGIRDAQDAERLLEAGADKVSVNTAAVARPGLLRELSERFGRQCTVLAIDAAKRDDGTYEVVTHSGRTRTGIDALDWAQRAIELGAGEILLTSWDRDGTRSGYELPLLRAMSEHVTVPVIASGGADTIDHLAEAIRAGADAVLAASIFHDGDRTVAEVKRALAERGARVRLEQDDLAKSARSEVRSPQSH